MDGGTVIALPNITEGEARANVRANSRRQLQWLGPVDAHEGHAVLVGGGPSAADCLPELKRRQKDGQRIFGLNGAVGWLVSHGIVPDYGVMLDPRPGNVKFLKPVREAWLVASQCDPVLFDRLDPSIVRLWHFADQITAQEVPDGSNPTLVGGGITSGLTAMALVFMLGYRMLHLFGYDSSDRAGDAHPYPQSENEAERKRVEVTCEGRQFTCGVAMYAQAQAFQSWAEMLAEAGATITVRGDGLLPTIAHAMHRATNTEGLAA